jgi:hypothetical protein
MSGITKHSEACCKYATTQPIPYTRRWLITGTRIPPVVDEGYSPKGKYIDLNGTKTCKPRLPQAKHQPTTSILTEPLQT